jgi:hypothetical protein
MKALAVFAFLFLTVWASASQQYDPAVAVQEENEYKPTEGVRLTVRKTAVRDSIPLTIQIFDGGYRLHWLLPPEYSCLAFTVERAWWPTFSPGPDAQWVELGTVPAFCSVFESTPHSFDDRNSSKLREGVMQYRLATHITQDERVHYYSELLLLGSLDALDIIDMYPRPASGNIHVSYTLPVSEAVEIRLYSMLGHIHAFPAVQSAKPGLHGITLDIADLPTGNYMLELRTAHTASRRLLRIVR